VPAPEVADQRLRLENGDQEARATRARRHLVHLSGTRS
jgi:hypothetical protein